MWPTKRKRRRFIVIPVPVPLQGSRLNAFFHVERSYSGTLSKDSPVRQDCSVIVVRLDAV
jgi:hypothetical protein